MTYEEKINRLASTKDPVPIHDLYSNSLFEFRFPMSETESYYLLQDCLVALYYQLYFLKQQCNFHRMKGAGDQAGDPFNWTRCRYGAEVKCDNISGWKCTENKGENKEQKQCGSSQASPLQAFLTDCLPGFTCKTVEDRMKTYCGKDKTFNTQSVYRSCYMEFLEHRTHLLVGQYCPIPMGFSGSFRKKSGEQPQPPQQTPVGMSGLGINGIVMYYANDDLTDSCLYQVTRCISSLTRRVPRSVGTIYGFFQGIISVYGGSGGDTQKDVFKKALDDELQLATFGLQGSVTLMEALMEWKTKSGDHQKDKCECLDSLSGCTDGSTKHATETSCGAYLHPLTGSLYNSVAKQYCDTYLSWILYLSGRLQDGLKALLLEFTMVDCGRYCCPKTGQCKDDCKCKCITNGCTPTKHGIASTTGTNSEGCCCENIVKCAGVYGLFYRFGFSMHSPGGLSKDKKRQCKDFYQQLDRVITGTLFQDLLKQIRAFLYTTRLTFGLVIFAFWSIVLVYLLWSMTVNLDLVHIKSHCRSPGSYLVPLQRILADGSRNVKRVCTIGYFQEANGDRLLSLGVSDVYL